MGQDGGHLGNVAKMTASAEEYARIREFKYVFPDKGHRHLLSAFADSLLNDAPSPIDEMASMRATYLSQRAMESIRRGAPLPVNVEDWGMYVHACNAAAVRGIGVRLGIPSLASKCWLCELGALAQNISFCLGRRL